jgi:hypothetical protein
MERCVRPDSPLPQAERCFGTLADRPVLLAVAFGYFENLFLLRDTVRVAQELARIKGFNKLLDQVGHQEDLYEIFVDATEDLLVQVSQAIAAGSYDESFLVNAFNDEYNSNAMITHFRVSRQLYDTSPLPPDLSL